MFAQLRKSINSRVEMSDEDFERLTSLLTCMHVPKETMLLKQGELSRYGIFICKGCLCFYIENEYGEEKVIDIATEGRWMGDAESYWFDKPTPYYIKALVDTEVLLMEKTKTLIAFKEIPSFLLYHFFALIDFRNYIFKSISGIVHNKAEDKYVTMLKNNPGIIQNIPLKYIASYLGITPQSFSRLRKAISRKKKN